MANSMVSVVIEGYRNPARAVQSELKKDEALLVVFFFSRLFGIVTMNGQIC